MREYNSWVYLTHLQDEPVSTIVGFYLTHLQDESVSTIVGVYLTHLQDEPVSTIVWVFSHTLPLRGYKLGKDPPFSTLFSYIFPSK